jgi:hypothetical protein
MIFHTPFCKILDSGPQYQISIVRPLFLPYIFDFGYDIVSIQKKTAVIPYFLQAREKKRDVSFKMPIHVVAPELHQPKLGLDKLVSSVCSKWSLKTGWTISEYHEQPPLGYDLCHIHVSQILCSHLKRERFVLQ